MSKIFSFVALVAFSAIVLFSCKKDDAVVVPVNKGVIKGLVSNTGTPFNVSDENVYLEKTYSNDSVPLPIYHINAIISKNPYKVFTLIFKGPLKANVYGLGSKQAQATYQIGTAPTDFYRTTADSSVISGVVNFSTYSTDTLIGTYNVTMKNTNGNKFDVTGGSFNCTYAW